MKVLLAVVLCSMTASSSEFGRLELMAGDQALIAPGYTGERSASGGPVSADASRPGPRFSLTSASKSERVLSTTPSPERPGKARKGRGLGRKLLLLAAVMAFFAVGGLFIGAIVGTVGLAFGATWAVQALTTGAGMGAGLGFAVGFPAAFQEQK